MLGSNISKMYVYCLHVNKHIIYIFELYVITLLLQLLNIHVYILHEISFPHFLHTEDNQYIIEFPSAINEWINTFFISCFHESCQFKTSVILSFYIQNNSH